MTLCHLIDDVPRKLALLHYHLRMFWLEADSLSLLRTLDDCANCCNDYVIPLDLELTDKMTVVEYIIKLLHASLMSVCIPEPSENSIARIKHLGSLYYRMVCFPSRCSDCSLLFCSLFL